VINLDALTRSARDLEPLPVSVTRLAALVANEGTDVREMAQVIAYDQALTIKLLESANSAANAGVTETSTAHDAVVRLGTGTVLSLALTTAVAKRMHRSLPEYGLSEGDLWRHSVASALAAELLPSFAKVRMPPETVTAALLHDVGKLVMARYLQPDVLDTLGRAGREGGLSRLAAETELLHVNHGELGGLMLQSWKLPDSIVRGVIYHHDPQQADSLICYAVHVCDLVAKAIGAGLEHENNDEEAHTSALQALQLKATEFGRLCEAAAERFSDVLARYGS
jgi:HD-like signal output (HDOD) protein